MSVFNPYHHKDCPFCHLDLSVNTILAQSEHFWIINNIKPLIKGHIMLITKDHYRDETEFPYYMWREFTQMSIKARKIVLARTGKMAMSFVNSVPDQSVHHWHRHFLPGVFGVHGVDSALRLKLKERGIYLLPHQEKSFLERIMSILPRLFS